MRKIFFVLLMLPIALVLLYGAGWSILYFAFNQAVNDLTADPEITFYGDPPALSGFPKTPVITLTKGININDTDILFPKMTVYGYPIPFAPLDINFPEGMGITYQQYEQPLIFDKVNLTIEVPSSLPKSTDYQDVWLWQRQVGHINIKNLELWQRDTYLKANGHIGFDDALQPELLLHSQLHNYRAIIQQIIAEQDMSPFAAGIAMSAVDTMAQLQDSSGNQFNFEISINDRNLKVGPVALGKIPVLYWER